MKNVFIIGCKGIPAKYGGFETFVDNLTYNKKDNNIKYYVSCFSDNDMEYEYNEAKCFNVKVKDIGSAKAVIYDIKSLKRCAKYIKQNNLSDCIIYILACRIGPFLKLYKSKLKKQGIRVFVNPDGHEWKRDKWNNFIKAYWRHSEKLMVKYADLLICDSIGIKDYIDKEYKIYNPNTKFIAYGAYVEKSNLSDYSETLTNWYRNFNLKSDEYYLIVGRFVPENNYEIIIREFMKSDTKKDLVIITDFKGNKFYKYLMKKTSFQKDNRIKFVGTVYDMKLLKKIRENAFAYIHGHEVGGTNPSLLESLASTNINLLYDINFNREVALDSAFYFNKSYGNLSNTIHDMDKLSEDAINEFGNKAKKRIINNYSWRKITNDYEKLFRCKQ